MPCSSSRSERRSIPATLGEPCHDQWVTRATGGGRGPRVIAGEAGGLRLATPPGTSTRPTADRVKEALFSALGPDRIEDASVLDGYAGSGALAIEALSRGAATAVLVDHDAQAVAAIRKNLVHTHLGARARVAQRDVAVFLRMPPPTPEAPFDLVLLDPPYDQPPSDLASALERARGPRLGAPGRRGGGRAGRHRRGSRPARGLGGHVGPGVRRYARAGHGPISSGSPLNHETVLTPAPGAPAAWQLPSVRDRSIR